MNITVIIKWHLINLCNKIYKMSISTVEPNQKQNLSVQSVLNMYRGRSCRSISKAINVDRDYSHWTTSEACHLCQMATSSSPQLCQSGPLSWSISYNHYGHTVPWGLQSEISVSFHAYSMMQHHGGFSAQGPFVANPEAFVLRAEGP